MAAATSTDVKGPTTDTIIQMGLAAGDPILLYNETDPRQSEAGYVTMRTGDMITCFIDNDDRRRSEVLSLPTDRIRYEFPDGVLPCDAETSHKTVWRSAMYALVVRTLSSAVAQAYKRTIVTSDNQTVSANAVGTEVGTANTWMIRVEHAYEPVRALLDFVSDQTSPNDAGVALSALSVAIDWGWFETVNQLVDEYDWTTLGIQHTAALGGLLAAMVRHGKGNERAAVIFRTTMARLIVPPKRKHAADKNQTKSKKSRRA